MERSIREVGGWAWQERGAVKAIAERYSGSKLAMARSIYMALTELASEQRTPGHCHTSLAWLGKAAGCSEDTARRYVHDFVAMGLVTAESRPHQASTYHIEAVAAIPANAAPSMRVPSLAAVQPKSKEITINNNYKQTVGDVAMPAMDTETVKQLTGLGVRRDVATEMAMLYPAAVIAAWVAYALKADGLKSRAGFVLAMLRSGATPPVTVARSGCERRFDGWQAVAKPTDEQRARWEMRELVSSYPQNISD